MIDLFGLSFHWTMIVIPGLFFVEVWLLARAMSK
jgi:hypothetical protein